MKTPRFEVVTTHYHPLDNILFAGRHHTTTQQFRWRWLARWMCFLINVSPSRNALVFGYQVARWRPVLRLVPTSERAA